MARKPRVEEFVVRLEMPEDVGIGEMQEYIDEAVGAWKGQLHPDNPLFDLDRDTVKVCRPHKRRTYLASFAGHDAPGFALMHEATQKAATRTLAKELKRIGLEQDVNPEDVEEIDGSENIIIVSNGDD
jgi:hypothetical protein